MKKNHFYVLAILLVILAACFSGCIEIKPVPSEVPSASPYQSVPESPTECPVESTSAKPIDELARPDYDVKTSILWDVNGDGVKETISVGLGSESEVGNDILLSVSDNGGFNTVTIGSGYFEYADYLQTTSGAPCIVVCCSFEDDYSSTTIVSFEGLKPVVHGSVDGTVMEVKGSGITVNTWVDALGTWPCYGFYNVTDSFSLERTFDFVINTADQIPLVTKIELPVEISKDGEDIKESLAAGTKIYPTVTDGETYMNFRLEDFTQGVIHFTKSNYECFIGEKNENDCFVEVPYAG